MKQVGMGRDLPPINTPVFIRYGIATIFDSLKYSSEKEIEYLRDFVSMINDSLHEQVKKGGIGNVPDEEFSDMNYQVNPFWVNPEDGTIAVAEVYSGIERINFSYLVLTVADGGMGGWTGVLQAPPGKIPSYIPEVIGGFNRTLSKI